MQDGNISLDNILENITLQFGLQQIVKKPTHIVHNSSLCIDLIFTSQPNLITESGVHLYFSSCHHQVRYAKFSLQIYYPRQFIIERSGITKMLILNLLEKCLKNLIVKKHFPIKKLTKKLILLIKQS